MCTLLNTHVMYVNTRHSRHSRQTLVIVVSSKLAAIKAATLIVCSNVFRLKTIVLYFIVQVQLIACCNQTLYISSVVNTK